MKKIMESLKKFSTASTGEPFFSVESLSQYDSYMHDVIRESEMCSRRAYEYVCSNPIIN